MSFLSHLRSGVHQGARRKKGRQTPSCRPTLEVLEDRWVPSTIVVNNPTDTPVFGEIDLRQAIVQANTTGGNETITFDKTVFKTPQTIDLSPILGQLELSDTTGKETITGPSAGVTVSGGGLSRVFQVDSGVTASISGLTITAGNTVNNGGGLYNLGTTALSNCTVSGNSASTGGGIDNEGALSVSNCTLNNNEALGTAAGGGFGGAIEDIASGTLTVSNSTFEDNKAIAVGANDPIVSSSYIFAAGGAIDLNEASTGSATIGNSTFTGNEALGGSPGASAGGGALSNSSDVGATMAVTNCTLMDNAAMGAAGGDGLTNFGSGQGGGINSIGALTVRNSTLVDNLAEGAPLAPNVVPSQTLTSNTGVAGGGIFCLDLGGGDVLIANSTLTGNQAVGGSGPAPAVAEGGGISLILVSSGTVTGCTVDDNVAQGGSGGAGVAGAPGASGGIDLAVFSAVTVSNTTLVGNQAIGGAGGAGANAGDSVGGAINVGTGVLLGFPDASSLVLSNCTVSGNSATSGGGIDNDGALSVSNCTLNNNEALGTAAGGGFGGAIEDNSSAELTVANSTFEDNKAIAVGANDPIVSNDYIFAAGGAIDLNLAGTGSATIGNSTFTGNEALGGSPGASAGGGALSNSSDVGATMTVTNCTIADNAAIGAAGGDGVNNFGSGQGGGINSIGALTVRNSTIDNNLAQGAPLAANVVPSQSLTSNTASAGGGIFCLDLGSGPVLIANSTINGNQAVGGAGAAPAIAEGGGISLVLVATGLVTDCTVNNNVARGGSGGPGVAGADGASGGIDLAAGSVVTVKNSTINNNQAIGGAGGSGAAGGNGVGGGIDVGTGYLVFGSPDDCSLILNNCTLNNNEAVGGGGGSGGTGGDGWGGGLSILTGSTANVSTSTINGNQADGGTKGSGGSAGAGIGGGVYNLGTFTVDAFTTIKGNHASTSDNDVYG